MWSNLLFTTRFAMTFFLTAMPYHSFGRTGVWTQQRASIALC
jgi:hypothetical protein